MGDAEQSMAIQGTVVKIYNVRSIRGDWSGMEPVGQILRF